MIAYVEGYSDTNDIRFCSVCGAEIITTHADGTGDCPECGMRFAVIQVDTEPKGGAAE